MGISNGCLVSSCQRYEYQYRKFHSQCFHINVSVIPPDNARLFQCLYSSMTHRQANSYLLGKFSQGLVSFFQYGFFFLFSCLSSLMNMLSIPLYYGFFHWERCM